MIKRHPIDVAISYSGEDRSKIDPVVNLLIAKKIRVFYDREERQRLWGHELRSEFLRIYGHDARYILAFISPHYLQKPWTLFELQTALDRLVRANDASLLIVRVSPTLLPDHVRNIAYFDYDQISGTDLVDGIRSKLMISLQTEIIDAGLASSHSEDRMQAILAMASLRDDRFSDTLCQTLLNDQSPEVRSRVAWALDLAKSSQSIPTLKTALNDPDWSVRSAVGWALVHLGASARDAVMHSSSHLETDDAREMAKLVLQRF